MQKNQIRSNSRSSHGTHDNIEIEGEGNVDARGGSGFRFGRIFPKISEPPVALKEKTCLEIGTAMTSQSPADRGNSDIPAGYTYFGQFVDHDITLDSTDKKDEADDPNTPVIEATPDNSLIQDRSPSLDLDSLYGDTNAGNKKFFENGSAKFKIGTTTASSSNTPVAGPINYDLPRVTPVAGSDNSARKALIGDGRNDENLAVAQTHLMWLKFHNHICDKIKAENPGISELLVFAQARDLTTRHYQYIVLHDFVKRFVQESVFKDVVVKGNRKHVPFCAGESPFMPLEFSVAAYRHGHSQVREEYDWNRNFGPHADALFRSPFRLLFQFSEVSGSLGGNPTLPTNWVADFRRLYDLSNHNFPHLNGSVTGGLNMAKRIDPYLAGDLGQLPELQPMVDNGMLPFSNLAALNLRRGSMRGLPSGQGVAKEMSIPPLTRAEMESVLDENFKEKMDTFELYERTPLWLYILLEASSQEEGNRLGTMGSTIVAETFLTLVKCSRISILYGSTSWHPKEAKSLLGAAKPLETIPEILAWMDEIEPIVDPLQDERLFPISV